MITEASALDEIIEHIVRKFDLCQEETEIQCHDIATCHSGAHVTTWCSFDISKGDLTLWVGAARCHLWEGDERPQVTIFGRR